MIVILSDESKKKIVEKMASSNLSIAEQCILVRNNFPNHYEEILEMYTAFKLAKFKWKNYEATKLLEMSF